MEPPCIQSLSPALSFPLLSSPHHLFSPPFLLLPPKLPRFSVLTCSYCHGVFFGPPLLRPQTPTWRNFSWSHRKRNNHHLLRASRRESPYEVLGVSPSATPQEIKRVYRKLALKYHPDVSREANAQEKFMRIKHAYNTLLNSESQFKYDSSNRSSDYSRTTSERNRNQTTQEEEFYGFADFLQDLQAEFQNWEAGINSQENPKSLWEELADIGEEFLEFLEEELNINDSKSEVGDDGDGSLKGNPYTKTNPQDEGSKESNIEASIDEIEATLAQLKKELGL